MIEPLIDSSMLRGNWGQSTLSPFDRLLTSLQLPSLSDFGRKQTPLSVSKLRLCLYHIGMGRRTHGKVGFSLSFSRGL